MNVASAANAAMVAAALLMLTLQRRFEGFPFFEFFEAAFTRGAVGLIVAPCVIFHQNHQVGRFAFGLRKAAVH